MDPKTYISFLSAIVPIFAAIATGALLRKIRWFTETAEDSLLRITSNILLPALILESVLHNRALKEISTVLLSPAIGFIFVGVGLGFAWACSKYAGKWFGVTGSSAVPTFALCIAIYNYSYMPFALAKFLAKVRFSPDTMGVLLVQNIGVEIFLSTFGLVFLGVSGAIRGWRKIINTPIITVIVALIINLAGLDQYVPRFIFWTAGLLGQCAVPLGLLLIGARLTDYFPEFHPLAGWKSLLVSSVLRLILLPMLFLVVARYLPVARELKETIILLSAMPAAVFPLITMIKHYGGDAPTAMRVAIGTSVISILTMPLWIYFGIRFAGI
jgi:malate permease and related proteins